MHPIHIPAMAEALADDRRRAFAATRPYPPATTPSRIARRRVRVRRLLFLLRRWRTA